MGDIMLRPIPALLIIALLISTRASFAQTLSEAWVCPDGNCGQAQGNYSSIQQALANVVDGGTVHVLPGTFSGPVYISRPVTLRGSGPAAVVISSSSSSDGIIIASSDVHISGLRVEGGAYGIRATTSHSTMRQLQFEGYGLGGMLLLNSSHTLVEGNTISGNGSGDGLTIGESHGITAAGNSITHNYRNVYLYGGSSRGPAKNLVQGNTLLSPGLWSVDIALDAGDVSVNCNVFSTPGTNDRYIRNARPRELNAQRNWFGGEDPPQASDFSGLVDYRFHFATNMTIFMFPTVHYMRPLDELDVIVLGLVPAGAQVRGTTITVGWNPSVATLTGAPVQGSFYTQKLVGQQQEFFAFDPLAPLNSVTVDQSLMGGSTGAGSGSSIPYVGMLFMMRFRGVATGATTITPTGVLVRDPDNLPLTTSIVAPTLMNVDGEPPSILDLKIDNTTLDTDENGDLIDDYVKNSDNITITASITDNNPLSLSRITADLSGFSGGTGNTAVHPASFVSGVATWILSGVNCSPANGTITVTVTVTDTVDNIATAPTTITSDNIAPSPVEGLYATPGHNKVVLSWSDPSGSDAHYKGALIRYAKWNGYPDYATPAPVFPPTPTGGSLAFASAPGTSVHHMFPPANRDIIFYSAFATDWAGNISTIDAGGRDFSTNYFLGDLGSGNGLQIPGTLGYDGNVNFDDLVWFSMLFGTSGSFPYPQGREADFAPTGATKQYPVRHRFGVPVPDGSVDFEDLMIFSLNYLSVAPKLPPPVSPERFERAGIFVVEEGIRTDSVRTVRVVLGNNGSEIKGCSVRLLLADDVIFAGGEAGDLFGGAGQGLYFITRHANAITVDAALLGVGRTVTHSGVLATLKFKLKNPAAGLPVIDRTDIRGLDNSGLDVAPPEVAEQIPAEMTLIQNYPNPFNPSTTIAFSLPAPGHVSIEISTILGRIVAAPVNRHMQAGRHTLVWTGRDDAGNALASGVYLYRLRAGGHVISRKMVLLR